LDRLLEIASALDKPLLHGIGAFLVDAWNKDFDVFLDSLGCWEKALLDGCAIKLDQANVSA
jgi:hypothetical protein